MYQRIDGMRDTIIDRGLIMKNIELVLKQMIE